MEVDETRSFSDTRVITLSILRVIAREAVAVTAVCVLVFWSSCYDKEGITGHDRSPTSRVSGRKIVVIVTVVRIVRVAIQECSVRSSVPLREGIAGEGLIREFKGHRGTSDRSKDVVSCQPSQFRHPRGAGRSEGHRPRMSRKGKHVLLSLSIINTLVPSLRQSWKFSSSFIRLHLRIICTI